MKNCFRLPNHLQLILFLLGLQFNLIAQSYDFEFDNVGSPPANITAANGTAIIDSDLARGQTMTVVSASSGNNAIFNLDLFPSTKDYAVTWKETYTTAGRSAFILRAFGANSSSAGMQQGYLFQANTILNNARIYTSNASGYTQLSSQSLPAAGIDSSRWYRATVDGNRLVFEYSDNGATFILIDEITDTTYRFGGTTQYIRGSGASFSGSFVDDISYSPCTPTYCGIYDFESETPGAAPSIVTAANGTAIIDSDPTRSQTMTVLSASSGNNAIFNMDLIPTATDYAVTWKETYTTAGRSGFILRGVDANSSSTGMQQGYLFQVNASLDNAKIYTSNATNYTQLSSQSLPAAGIGSPRWYRATVDGSMLVFEYSNDGSTFILIDNISNAKFSSGGTTQYVRGSGATIPGSFIDDISYKIDSDIYDFECETAGNPPVNITAVNGTAIIDNDAARGQTMTPVSASSGNKAIFNLDLFPSTQDYAVTWKETYTSAGRSAFILRAFGANSSGPGLQQGYLFQVNANLNTARIFTSDASGYTQLSSKSLTAPGIDSPRWYRASVDGSRIMFEYSNNGVTFIPIDDLMDTTYPSGGTTQYVRGYGGPIQGSFIDDIKLSQFTTNIKEYQVFQRNSADQADIFITGSYKGEPTAIEASFNGGAYQTIDSSPTCGTYSGTLSTQNSGQGTLIIRYTNDPLTAISVDHVGIGDIFVIAGQSNASGRGNTLNAYTHPTIKASLFGNNDVWQELTDATDSGVGQIDLVSKDNGAQGSPWPLVATSILDKTGVPVAFIPTSKGGTSIGQWQPGTGLYQSMHRRITAVGGEVAGVVFLQGAKDVGLGTSQATYEARLGALADAIATDFPGTKTMVGNSDFFPDVGIDRIRAAQMATVNVNPNVVLGPVTYDINLGDESGDSLHFKTDGDMALFATYLFAAMDEEYYGAADGHGPVLERLIYVNNKITVSFTDVSSPIIHPASTVGTSSFDLKANGVSVGISGIAIVGETIEITPATTLNTSLPITLSYASENTGADAAIYDINNYPAIPFYNEPVGLFEITLDLGVWLEGCYDMNGLQLTNELQQKGLLPSGQPYFGAPWNYNGTEGGGWMPSDYPPGAIDWLLLSLRTTPQSSSEVAKAAVLLMEDGTISPTTIGLNGDSVTAFYIVVEHRNHIPAMTPTAIPLVNNTLTYDFRTSNSYNVGAGFGQKQLGSQWALFSGEISQSSPVGYEVTGADNILWQVANGNFGAYMPEDTNMDGDVNGIDRILINLNNGISSSVLK